MGAPWNIDETIWPGPCSYEEHIKYQTAKKMTAACQNLGISMRDLTKRLHRIKRLPRPVVTHVGPRSKMTFDRTGRRKF